MGTSWTAIRVESRFVADSFRITQEAVRAAPLPQCDCVGYSVQNRCVDEVCDRKQGWIGPRDGSTVYVAI